jgi:hypothetical protein
VIEHRAIKSLGVREEWRWRRMQVDVVNVQGVDGKLVMVDKA